MRILSLTAAVVVGVLAASIAFAMVHQANSIIRANLSNVACDQYVDLLYLLFSDDSKMHGKSIAFHFDTKDAVVSTPGINHAINWSDIERISLMESSPDAGVFVVEFNPDLHLPLAQEFPIVVFGTLQRECWALLVEKIASHVRIEVDEMQ